MENVTKADITKQMTDTYIEINDDLDNIISDLERASVYITHIKYNLARFVKLHIEQVQSSIDSAKQEAYLNTMMSIKV